MDQLTTTYVATDTHKRMISSAVAKSGRRGEVRLVGEIPNRPESVAKMIERCRKAFAAKRRKLAFCYEASPCSYGLHRQITMLGYECVVVALPCSNAARRPRQGRPP